MRNVHRLTTSTTAALRSERYSYWRSAATDVVRKNSLRWDFDLNRGTHHARTLIDEA